jgi:hypothetical protein
MSTTDETVDAVALMREIRERMSREMEGMTKEERLRYLNDGWQPDVAEKSQNSRDHAA